MTDQATIRGITFNPALLCAPLAGLTHSAFRRLASEFGGCGGFYTEMLSAKQILRENLENSPYLKRNPLEPRLVYQLMICKGDPIDRVIGRLSEIRPDGIDINLACHAPVAKQLDTGSRLFDNDRLLPGTLEAVRGCWPGLLTVKVRLGHDKPGWEERFAARMRLFEETGVDAVVLHPRFFEDRFKRRARHELLPWAASLTRLPIIANGDITGPASVEKQADRFRHASALMIGRMAVVQPWIFAAHAGPAAVNLADTWQRLAAYVLEDFKPESAIGRIKAFTHYYARNFKFGHNFAAAIQSAPTLDALKERAESFLSKSPETDPDPSVMGL